MKKTTKGLPAKVVIPAKAGIQVFNLPLKILDSRLKRSGMTGLLKKTNKGFTLVELMLVVIIIGTLVAMIVPRFAGRSKEAKMTATMADINSNIATALDLFELDNGFYPSTEQGLGALTKKPSSSPVPKRWKGPYFKKGIPKDPWGNRYVYRSPGTHSQTGYDLLSYGPDGMEGGDDDISNWETSE